MNTAFLAAYEALPTTEADIHWAADVARQVYTGVDVIPAATMLAWLAANPTGFTTVWHAGQRVGTFHALPLKPAYLEQLVAGTLLERDVPAEALYTPAEAGSIRELYWESIAKVPGSNTPGGMLTVMLYHAPALVARICPQAQITNIYAIAASAAGTEAMRRVGLSPLGDPASRLDGHQLYRGSMQSFMAAHQQLLAYLENNAAR